MNKGKLCISILEFVDQSDPSTVEMYTSTLDRGFILISSLGTSGMHLTGSARPWFEIGFLAVQATECIGEVVSRSNFC
ncbi:hypothetical protein COCC4DRAFT_29528 [Bipolaris maydis ATCC 48331]|uniref:Uncharacterized protein n=3 Tax=Cochliobolus heterostrophus TaxID=5016 RepID=M2V8M6_COCH5|nr:uncharacterized protein COCC4DRAFT_29528 [Bipolaris maydis ATCC 48331]EMD96098.1 hypothetical protein COCHEDRAFT_1019541 [Bipolaris maydis C5]ENI10957.1 hypothetical protein COCC4DRAFT_29528 [Bipolaris maydis ATCC 48331]